MRLYLRCQLCKHAIEHSALVLSLRRSRIQTPTASESFVDHV